MMEEPDRPQKDPGEKEPPTDSSEANIAGPEVIRAFVKALPAGPGVYRMLDCEGEILYVGKARNLKKRVTSYTKFGGHTNRIARVIANTASMEFVTTGSETEALLLEANLIKRLKPRYNIILRDDKSFPHILVTGDHDFAQILKHRGAQNQVGEYFGPFASALSVNQTLNTLQRAFLLRSCSDSVFENRTRPCLLYQIKRCSAPCVGYIDQGSYKSLVEDARDFLRGKSKRIKDQLTNIMETASKDLDFERAAVYRDRIRALSHVQLHQGINPASLEEADVIAADQQAGQTCVQVFFFRANQNWGNRAYYPRHDRSQEISDVLEAFVAQFYDNKPAPRQILLSHPVPNQTLLEEALSTRAGRRVSVLTPQRGEKKEIVAHAQSNAKSALARRLSENASERQLLEKVAEAFGMNAPPDRIEVYDNSHIQGSHPVGGMIVSGVGGFQKNQYRKFNIKDKEIAAGDDYGMLEEVLSRRFSRLVKEEAKRIEKEDEADVADPEQKSQWPDLVLIDGGAGQLSVARAVFEELGIEDVTLVSIAKGPDRNAGRERFFMPDRSPFSLEFGSPVLYFLQRLRDEAHRFAIGSHRARRQSAIKKSALDSVPGIGAARKRALLNHFGSARAVERAGLADLQDVEGISKSMAQKIYDYFHENR